MTYVGNRTINMLFHVGNKITSQHSCNTSIWLHVNSLQQRVQASGTQTKARCV